MNGQALAEPADADAPASPAASADRTGILEAVGRIAVSIAGCLDVDALVAEVVASVKALLGAEAASVLLADEGSGQLVFHHVDGGLARDALPVRLDPGEGVAGWVAQTRTAIAVPAVSEDPRFARRVDDETGFVTRTIAAAPLVVAGRLVGVLEVLNREDGGGFGVADARTLEALAPHVAVAVDNARITAALRRRTVHLERELRIRMAQVVFAKKEIERTIDAIDEPIALVEPNHRIRRANMAVARLAGVEIVTIPGRKCHETIFGRSDPCPGCPLPQSVEGRPAWATLELGDETHLASHFPIDDGEGNVYAVACSYRDLTESQALEHRLREAERMASVGQLAAGVAHEINNPMAFLASNLSTLRDYFDGLGRAATSSAAGDGAGQDDPEDLAFLISDGKTILDECEAGASRVTHIVQQLKSFARERHSAEQPIRLSDCLARITHQLAPLYPEATFQIDVASERRVLACPISVDQALRAILQNGLQAAPAGTLGVRLLDDGDDVCVVVEDEGPGIDEEIRNRIFDPFFTTRGIGSGLGLGLTTAYATVRRYRGRIEVQDRAEGGTRILVVLPAVAEADAPRPSASARP